MIPKSLFKEKKEIASYVGLSPNSFYNIGKKYNFTDISRLRNDIGNELKPSFFRSINKYIM